jgi:hypothetical protein
MKGNLAWANGDTTGYGGHGDFINGYVDPQASFWHCPILTSHESAGGMSGPSRPH